MEKWFPIQTPRLLLREFTAVDEDDVHEYASDAAVVQYTGGIRQRYYARVGTPKRFAETDDVSIRITLP
jgi:RimJ/RimL family protein N-acetyltransferase